MAEDTSLRDYLIEEFVEDYQERRLTRREALKRLMGLTGSLAMANSILAACTPAPPPQPQATATATAQPTATATAVPTPPGPGVSPGDPALQAEAVQFPGQGVTLVGYLARPKGNGPFPAVLICHENRGLVEHTRDVARRFAKAGYAGFAVDLLSRQGGTDKVADPAQVPGILGNPAVTPPQQHVDDFQAGLRYLQTLPEIDKNRIGMVGFCFGGGVTWRVATKTPELRAAVPFYGPIPALEEVADVQAAVLAMYGEQDQRINQGIPSIEEAMKANGKTFEKAVYPGAGHAFFNDTGQSYRPDAAQDAWIKTLAWFDKYLRA